MSVRRVLLVDDDAAVREALGQTLELAEFDAITAGSFVEAKDRIGPRFEGVIVSDIRMPGRDGFHLLDYAHEQDAELPVILLTGEGDIPMAVRAMSAGAFDFLEKPCAPAELISVIERALRTRSLVLENRRLKAQLETGDPAARMIFGISPQSESLRAQARAAARAGTDVLIRGARGSGIPKVAEVVHLCSSRAKGAFEKRSAAGLSRDDLSELWQGCAGGTLFLDEIGQLPMDTQMALQDALEAGGARLIAGTVEDLGAQVEAGGFSAELFYRLEVMQLRIPALSERPEDIPVLFRHYVAQAAEQSGLPEPEIGEEMIAGLIARDWPGNARSLMSAAMRFVLGLGEKDASDEGLGLSERLAQVERSLLADALRRTGGQASAAAEMLKLPRKTFYDKLAKYGLKAEAFR
ncbi:MAG: sigma-54-dependent Fis family transcriptional regulator [Rhodobacteraceae bacterium]|jgi:two-component system C4-dicarboxylate transport response regulator DctD|uniref:Two component, sigma54 specific, transcriptional regulator, Fis family n=1 Tax=Salipiger profundus TaxID=1229727 RepID=A0A1U7DAQ7_9RHOB|nr:MULTISPECIES: sigma-54 dependent transcriptional regulator [Salipiger]APX25213.1 two component, sigma54 specific, transcriptional regulator, Fis family [Salipiger profundus]MAB05549.1 sigma-54-dependent Fis family transcriptional regulator [Paracoccaceae bacterium]GGA16116.1 Fis family transcriptional regulator [Salipiger profundus]SFD08016.1 two component, sigma54 specific, transcriptional regulator, Fis family [Salipiger profundus]